MSSWRDALLIDFVPNVSKLTLVADPDGLLTEEKLALELRNRGFDLVEFADAVEFRYAYESRYRTLWDRGERTDLVVILRVHGSELEALPYDLLQAGRKLAFDLGGLFPNLSYPVIEKLDRSLLDALFDAQRKSPPDRLGDNSTKDFVLLHLYGVAAALITNEVELLRVLLRLHYNKNRIPLELSRRLVQVLKGNDCFRNWPLDEIVPDEEAFFAFLQERWPLFLRSVCSAGQVYEDSADYRVTYPGPELLPFGHHDIRVYIDNLFVEGKLAPVKKPEGFTDADSWIRCGVIEIDGNDDAVRISRLFDIVEKELPTIESRHSDWLAFAHKWAELSALVHCRDGKADKKRLLKSGSELNRVFARWLNENYASLITLTPANPALLHHVPRRLARDQEEGTDGRVALLVIDGLSLDQWVTIRQILQEQDATLVMREAAIFAWIPTLTAVSRQSIFSGKQPLYFPLSIDSTNNEEKHWKQYWEGAGIPRADITYQRGLGDGDVATVLESVVHPDKTKVIGLVVDKVDKIMHGMQLGSAGMHNQISQWCKGGYLGSLIGYLMDQRYQVWLTSDHGNLECHGKGRPAEGVIAETRGERVRIYSTPELRSQVAINYPFAHEWQLVGLPSGYYPLVAGGNSAFVKEGDVIVGHGGCSIEEVIVPLVKFERKTR